MMFLHTPFNTCLFIFLLNVIIWHNSYRSIGFLLICNIPIIILPILWMPLESNEFVIYKHSIRSTTKVCLTLCIVAFSFALTKRLYIHYYLWKHVKMNITCYIMIYVKLSTSAILKMTGYSFIWHIMLEPPLTVIIGCSARCFICTLS